MEAKTRPRCWFEAGYKKHLEWHKSNGDKWSWYGWSMASGPRDGQFVNATFDHAWSDFDNPVNPAGYGADNQLHTYPFADFQTLFRVQCLRSQSISRGNGLKSKFLRLITLDVKNIPDGIKVLAGLKSRYQDINVFYALQGHRRREHKSSILILGFDNWQQFGKSENFQEEIAQVENEVGTKAIEAITSEILIFRPDMSLFRVRKKRAARNDSLPLNL